MRRSATLLLLPFLPLLLATPALAQEKAAPAVPAKAAPKVVVVPPGEISIAQLVEAAARASARNILCTEGEVSGQKPIALTEPVTLDPATCDDTLCNLLYTRGLALVPVETGRGILEVINMAGPRGREVMAAAVTKTPEEVLAQPESKRAVMTTVRLQHVNAPVMVNMLRPMCASGPSGLQLGNVGNNEGLILRGFQRDVATAVRLIQENDKPPAGPGGGPVPPPGLAAAGAPPGDLAARVAALEKQVEELKRLVASLQQAAGK